MAKKVLVVDDEKLIVKGIRFSLEQDGMEVDCAYDGEEALNLAKANAYDMVLLDIMLPKMDGFEVCQAIREFSDMPIVMLTAKGDDMDKILGLEYGADDYITKPFSIKELIARIQMHLRREERSHNASKEEMDSNITFYRDSQEVYYQSKRISLTKREFDLLYLLAKNENRIFSIEELYNYLYPISSDAQLRSITEYIYQIRQKFKIHQIDPIKTVWGGGYKWKKN